MMRPIGLFSLLIFFISTPSVGQDPVTAALRILTWPSVSNNPITADYQGVSWSVFTRQYFCVSNWNAAGISVNYSTGRGQSGALICRDGIPGFSWYHVYLSHYTQFEKVSGMLQLRFSLIDLYDRPLVFRIGGNIQTNLFLSHNLSLQVSMYDFSGWILPGKTVAGGDPLMQFLLLHEPGRLIGLAAGFMISRWQFGPVAAGLRVRFDDRIELSGLFEILPFGVSLGIRYNLDGCKIRGWVDQRHGIGLTPMMEISSH